VQIETPGRDPVQDFSRLVKVGGGPRPPPVDPDTPPPVDPSKVTDVVYVYEKDKGAVPSGVLVGLDRLRRERNIAAITFERDTKDGTGRTPPQREAALKAANEAGLPAIVVSAGGQVLRVVKSPTTEQQVMEAAQ
jgi:hypothetical protein